MEESREMDTERVLDVATVVGMLKKSKARGLERFPSHARPLALPIDEQEFSALTLFET